MSPADDITTWQLYLAGRETTRLRVLQLEGVCWGPGEIGQRKGGKGYVAGELQ